MDYQATRIELSGQPGDDLSFRGDSVMPAQFYPARRGSAALEPIMRLMAGILIDAVRCFQNNCDARTQARRKEFKEAHFWIFDDNGIGPFSFQSVCDALEIDPAALREWIGRWQKNRLAGEKRRTIRRSPVNITVKMQSRRKRVERGAFRAMSRE